MRCTAVALRRFRTTCCLLTLGVLLGPTALRAAPPLGPAALAVAKDGSRVFVANADAKQLMLVDPAAGKVVGTTDLPAQPTAAVLSPDGTRLYVTCAAAKSTVCVIEAATGRLAASIPAGHTASGRGGHARRQAALRLQSLRQRRVGDRLGLRQGVGPREGGSRAVGRRGHARRPARYSSSTICRWIAPTAPDVAAVVTAIDTAGNQAAVHPAAQRQHGRAGAVPLAGRQVFRTSSTSCPATRCRPRNWIAAG